MSTQQARDFIFNSLVTGLNNIQSIGNLGVSVLQQVANSVQPVATTNEELAHRFLVDGNSFLPRLEDLYEALNTAFVQILHSQQITPEPGQVEQQLQFLVDLARTPQCRQTGDNCGFQNLHMVDANISYTSPEDAAASTASQWADPPVYNGEKMGQADWHQILGQVYLEFRSSVLVEGDILFVYGTKGAGKDWHKIILPPGGQNIGNEVAAGASYPYQAKDIISTFNAPLNVQPAGMKDLNKFTGPNGNTLYPLLSWYDDRNGKVLFRDMPGTNRGQQLVVRPNTREWQILQDRFNQWMESNHSAIKKYTPFGQQGAFWEHIQNCFVGSLSGTPVNGGQDHVPLLLALYNDLNDMQQQIIRSAFPLLEQVGQQITAAGGTKGALTQWLSSLGALAPNCFGTQGLGPYQEATARCGNILASGVNGACPFAVRGGEGWQLHPGLIMNQTELDTEHQRSGIAASFSSWWWGDDISVINHAALCSPGIWVFVDLPSMPHSLLVIIRNGIFYSIGVGAPEGQWEGSKGSRRGGGKQRGGDSGKLVIYSPDDSILGGTSINRNRQFVGALSSDLLRTQNARMIGYYNSGIQNRLHQALVAAAGQGLGQISGTMKEVKMIMPPSFGSYNTLSRGGWLWFMTGGVNCTSFTQWVSGTGVCGQIMACPHSLLMKQNQLTCLPAGELEGGKRKTRRRKHRKRTKHRRRRQKKTRHNKNKKKRRRKRTRR